MIKLIPVEKLVPGMYVHDLNCAWTHHTFYRSRFAVNDEEIVRRILDLGIREIYIDISRGTDVASAPTKQEVERRVDDTIHALASGSVLAGSGGSGRNMPRASLGEDLEPARIVRRDARRAVRDAMRSARLGKPIDIDGIQRIVRRIADAVFHKPGALLSALHLKDQDEYIHVHSVAVCALMIAFARRLDLPYEIIHEIAIGALLHDIGKAKVAGDALILPRRLTGLEFQRMKNHVGQGKLILRNTPGISDIALAVVTQHHERFDGTGYPKGLKGDEISLYGQMSAIVDVYDAITSTRVYRKAMTQTDALRKLVEWSKFHFNPDLVRTFIQAIGLYPAGSLVRLATGHLAVVQEHHPDRLMQPSVKAIFHVKGYYLMPATIDLRQSPNRIVGHESFDTWALDPARWLPEYPYK